MSSPSRDVGVVHGQVVVDELAEVGVARRDGPGAAAATHHGQRHLLGQGRPERRALRPHAREPEGRRRAGRQWRGGRHTGVRGRRDGIGVAAVATTGLLTDDPLTLDEERLGTVLSGHAATVKPGDGG